MFDIYTKYDLSYLGDEWKDCYLKFHPFTVEDLSIIKELEGLDQEETGEKVAQILSDKFVDGFAIDEGEKVAVTKETVKKFPLSILLGIVNSFSTGMDKKKENLSETSSEDTKSANQSPS